MQRIALLGINLVRALQLMVFRAVMSITNSSVRRIVGGLTLAAFTTLTSGCHTAEGVKQDTKNALDATGKGLQKAAAKIKGNDDAVSQKAAKKEDQPDAQAPIRIGDSVPSRH